VEYFESGGKSKLFTIRKSRSPTFMGTSWRVSLYWGLTAHYGASKLAPLWSYECYNSEIIHYGPAPCVCGSLSWRRRIRCSTNWKPRLGKVKTSTKLRYLKYLGEIADIW